MREVSSVSLFDFEDNEIRTVREAGPYKVQKTLAGTVGTFFEGGSGGTFFQKVPPDRIHPIISLMISLAMSSPAAPGTNEMLAGVVRRRASSPESHAVLSCRGSPPDKTGSSRE